MRYCTKVIAGGKTIEIVVSSCINILVGMAVEESSVLVHIVKIGKLIVLVYVVFLCSLRDHVGGPMGVWVIIWVVPIKLVNILWDCNYLCYFEITIIYI